MTRFADRYPYLFGLLAWVGVLLLMVVFIVSTVWLFSHQGCAHPVGNTLAAVGYVASGTVLLLPVACALLTRHLPHAGE